jgi:hypothetical protein
MGITSTHPKYDSHVAIWKMVADSYEGEAVVKAANKKYLPATPGQKADGAGTADTVGEGAYLDYLLRSVYPDLYSDSVDKSIGTMHRKPPNIITLPPAVESLKKNATSLGESIAALLRRVNLAQIAYGRIGILGDLRTLGTVVTPTITLYDALAIRNWDFSNATTDTSVLSLVVLDESAWVIDGALQWDWEERYRILAMGTKVGDEWVRDPLGRTYITGVVKGEDDITGAVFSAPTHLGNTLDEIPFRFINSKDLSPEPDKPPLLGLANLCMTIYRGEADYRASLFMQGQDTWVEIGHLPGSEQDAPRRLGAGAAVRVPLGGDAKYEGVSSEGLAEQRSALENDYTRGSQRGGQSLETNSAGGASSGEALRIRVSSQTTSLPHVAEVAAAGVAQVIMSICQWFNANPLDVDIRPNMDFINEIMDGQTLAQIMQSKALGSPFSMRSIHAWGVEQGMTKLTFEEEMIAIDAELTDDGM